MVGLFNPITRVITYSTFKEKLVGYFTPINGVITYLTKKHGGFIQPYNQSYNLQYL